MSKSEYYIKRIEMLSKVGLSAVNAEIETAANDDTLTTAEYITIYDYALSIIAAM